MSNTTRARLGVALKMRFAAADRRFATDQSGTSAIEYGIMMLIGIAIMALVSEIGGSVSGMFEKLQNVFG
jgi:Flp pilus assembly pilin Flp